MTEVPVHTVAVVIPVYRGATSLPALAEELAPLATEIRHTPGGRPFQLVEIVLSYDHGPDASDVVIRELESEYPIVRGVWLSRNFGQHPATLAGIASTTADWIVTMDEDGQHDPAYIPKMLDVALDSRTAVVYAKPTNKPHHPAFRNATSRAAKFVANNLLISGGLGEYNSFRLILGEIGRSLAAYSGPGTYLDAALAWISPTSVTCETVVRAEDGRPSGYNLRHLMSHFWRLVLTSGTRPLRVVSVLGAALGAIGIGFAIYAVIDKLVNRTPLPVGWASLMVVLLGGLGTLLFALGVVAEYIGVSVRMAMGRPSYLIVSDPAAGPLGRDRVTAPETSREHSSTSAR